LFYSVSSGNANTRERRISFLLNRFSKKIKNKKLKTNNKTKKERRSFL